MTLIFIGLIGLCFGSFAGAVISRLHTKEGLFRERSHCDHCRHVLGLLDLIPVFSWILLRGRCRYCNKEISVQLPGIELLTAFLFVLSYLQWPVGQQDYLGLAVWLGIIVGFVILLIYDLRWLILPDKVILPLVALAVIHILLHGSPGLIFSGPLAAIVFGGIFYLLFIVSDGRWIGGGDVKLIFLMGLLLGIGRTILALFLASVSGALVSLMLIGAHKLTRKDVIPFGPFLIMATIVSMLFGDEIISFYLDVTFGSGR